MSDDDKWVSVRPKPDRDTEQAREQAKAVEAFLNHHLEEEYQRMLRDLWAKWMPGAERPKR